MRRAEDGSDPMGYTVNQIAKLNPISLAFFSGILASVAVNLLTDLAISDKFDKRNLYTLLASLLFLASAFSWASLSWSLEEPHSDWKIMKRRTDLWPGMTDEERLRRAIGSLAVKLIVLFVVAVLFFVGALVVSMIALLGCA